MSFKLQYHFSNNCGYCKKLKPILNKVKKDFKDKLEFKDIDCVNNKETCQEWGISGFPTLVLLEDGKEVSRLKGYAPEDKVTKFIEDGLNGVTPPIEAPDVKEPTQEDIDQKVQYLVRKLEGITLGFDDLSEDVEKIVFSTLSTGKVSTNNKRHLIDLINKIYKV